MIRTQVLAFMALMAFLKAGSAQSIDELPAEVYKAGLSLEKACKRQGGMPDYEPQNLVTLVFFGADWDNGGRESYVIDTSRFRCSGIGSDRELLFCSAGQCKLIVMTPKGKSGFSKGLERLVSDWRLVGDNAASKGPNVLLQTTENGSNLLYKGSASGMKRSGPGD